MGIESENRMSGIDRLFESGKDAFSIWNLLKRFLLFVFFGIIISLRQLIISLNNVGQAGGGTLNYLRVAGATTWKGALITLSSIYPVILDLITTRTYIAENSVGTLIFTGVSFVALVFLIYQPISLIINAVDMKKGHATSTVFRFIVTILVVIFGSLISFYAGGQQTIFDVAVPEAIVDTVVQTTKNVTDTVSSGSVISLL